MTMADPNGNARERISGESWVWLTATGLGVALLMVLAMILVVAWNGLGVFWPKQVDQFTLTIPGKEGQPGTTQRWFAIEVGSQLKRPPGQAATPEVQLYVANKELRGTDTTYLWVDASQVRHENAPDVLVIERRTGGTAFGMPVELRRRGGETVRADSSGFDAALAAAIGKAAKHEEQIRHLKKDRIGRDAERVKALQERRGLLDRRGRLSPEEARSIDAEIARLEADRDRLMPEVRRLEALFADETLVLAAADGRRIEIPGGAILDAHRPNQLGFFGRIGRFLANGWNFLSSEPREANTEGGIWPAIFGTFMMTILMSMAVVPFGVITAIYLREYARQGPLVRFVRISVNNLAGVPSIVFGVFGLGFFVYICGAQLDRWFYPGASTQVFGTGTVLWSALTLALLTVPVVIVATEESIAAVPRGAREGSLACGASKWQTIRNIVLPASVPGILTGLILAMARGAGEVAPLMLVGVVKLAPDLVFDGSMHPNDLIPFVHLQNKFMHLGFHIYDVGFQSPDSEAAKPMVFATTLVLILLVLVLNLFAIFMRTRLRRKFATGAF